jgi:glycine cleavage system regulatory protein
MSLQIKLQSLSGLAIQIPWAIGFQLLDNGSDMWLYRLSQPANDALIEYIITPYKRRMWQDLWSISMTNSDEPGILRRLADLLQDRNINILSLNSSTIELGKYHSSRIIIDCINYSSPHDRTGHDRSYQAAAALNQLKREIELDFLKELRFFHPDYPDLSLERIHVLWRLYHQYNFNSWGSENKLLVNNGRVNLPEKEINAVRRFYAHKYKVELESLVAPLGLISIDHTADVIRIFPFFKNLAIVPLSIVLENRPGAVAAISKALSDNNFNIIASKAWIAEDQGESTTVVWMLLQDLKRDQFPCDDSLVTQDIKEFIGRSDELKDYNPRFPFQSM